MITIYDQKTTDFSNNGYGSIESDIIKPIVHWKMNSLFNFEFDYLSDSPHFEHLVNKNILKVPVPFLDNQLFRIYRTTKILGGIRVFAHHIFYDLLDNLVEDTFIVNKNGQGALEQLLGATQFNHHFQSFSDITTRSNARIVRRNPVEALVDDDLSNSIVSRWGGELFLDNFNVHLRKRLGANRGVRVEHKKDLLGYESTIDESTVATRIYPRGFDGLELPERYIDSPKLDPDSPKIKIIRYEDVKAAVGEYADDEDAIPLEEALEELRRLAKAEYEVNHIDEPETAISVDFVTLHNTEEYKEFKHLQTIHQGDTVEVSVKDEGFEITSRMVEFKSDPRYKDEYISLTLGNHVSEFTSSSTIPSRIRNSIDEVTDLAFKAYQSSNSKNLTYWGSVNPNNLDLDPRVNDRFIQENGDIKHFWIYIERDGQKFWYEVTNNSESSEVKKIINETIEEFEEMKKNIDDFGGLITIIEGKPYIAGKSIYLDGDVKSDGTFTITEEMIAPEIITDHLKATGINAAEIDVINLTADSFLAKKLDVAGGFRIMNGTNEVLSIDENGQTVFNAPNVATKDDLKTIELTPGPPGPKGEQGPQGVKGEDGKPTYTWIRYADTSTGSGISNSPSGKEYIGLAHNKETSIESNDPNDYTWSLIRGPKGDTGNRGVEGPKGKDGQTTYTWIKYSANANGSGLTDTPQANTAYIGIATNKTIPDESNTPSDYTWSLFKGPKGKDGEDGSDGVSVSSTTMQFYQSTSSTELKGGAWSDTPPNWKDGQYIWTRIATNYSNGQTSVSDPVNATGQTGSPGQSGRSVVNVSGQYYLSSSKEQRTGGAWVNSPPIWKQGFYVWTRLKIDYSNPSGTEYTEPTVDSSWEAIDELVYENRNLLENSENLKASWETDSYGTYTYLLRIDIISILPKIEIGETLTFSMDVWAESATTLRVYDSNGNPSTSFGSHALSVPEGNSRQSFTRTITSSSRESTDWIMDVYNNNNGIKFEFSNVKIEKGTKATPFSIAPEDIQGQIDSKANQESLDEVSTELSDFQTVVASREELGEVTSALYDYIDDLYRNERNLESAREDIDRLLTRLPIIENNLGAWVERWSFLDTYVTLGDEGLMISEMNGSTGIRISKDRIDFMDGSGEPVAYITNQVMRINRAIFVDSIQVGEHKVETIAGGHTIWQWMGG